MWIFWCLIITLVLLISAASELVWCLLGDGLTKSILPWQFTRQGTRFWVFDVHSAFRRECPSISTRSWNGTIYPPSPIAKTSTTKRSQRGANFTVDEDIKLVSAWLNVSLDAVTSTDQKHTTFWDRIWSTFHDDKKFNRSKDSLCSRWSTIQRETNKFCGYLAQMENRNESGKTEHDKVFRLT